MRLSLIFALTVMAMAACSGGSSPSATPTPEVHTVTGIMTIESTSCDQVATSIYSQIPGLQMAIEDPQRIVLATATVSTLGVTKGTPPSCQYRFSFGNVPREDSYTVDGGSVGKTTYTYDELKGDNWQVAVKVGS